MDVPNELPIIYARKVLIPGYILKIRLQVENNSNLLNYVQTNCDSKSMHIGIIPESDFDKAENIIGTVGRVLSIIKVDSVPEDFVLVMEGICRFKLDEKISEEPLQINKIITIENFKILQGDEKTIHELNAEFIKVVKDFLTYTTPSVFARDTLKMLFDKTPLYQSVDILLKTFVRLTPADAYEILRATSLNNLLRFVINWLKRETINEDKCSKSEKTGLAPVPSTLLNGNGVKRSIFLKKPISQELNQIQLAIKSV
eukprot:XP_016657061.1 PREDICTED: lon protease-like [Acyrthosiphon pisum]